MKIREGFVSNSSSSSFVILAPKEYDWKNGLSENEIKIYEDSFQPSYRNVFGKEMVIYSGYSDDENNINYSSIAQELLGDDWGAYSEMWDKFTSLFNKNECFVYWSEY